MNRLAALLVIIAGCKPAPPAKPATSARSPDECTTGKTKQTPTTDCTCVRATPHSAVRPPEADVHAYWACTDYGEPSCFGVVQGKACTTDGQTCTVTEEDSCMTEFACTSGAWASAGPPRCAPASRS